MRFLSILISAASVAVAVAQSTSNIAFTTVPASVQVGQSYNISWAGGDNTAVTITLRKGDPDDLQTVQILTTDATGSSFSWTPTSSLINGDDYALQITQGLDSINYSGEFSVSGGVDPISASISSFLAASSSSASAASANATLSSSTSASTTAAGAAGGASGASLGTGTALPRNTTFSSASLGPSSTTATTTASITSASGLSTGSGSSSASSPTSTTGEAASFQYSSPIALFCGIMAAVAYAI